LGALLRDFLCLFAFGRIPTTGARLRLVCSADGEGVSRGVLSRSEGVGEEDDMVGADTTIGKVNDIN
jgi:hypothetical protein